jgi:hypothetical protein
MDRDNISFFGVNDDCQPCFLDRPLIAMFKAKSGQGYKFNSGISDKINYDGSRVRQDVMIYFWHSIKIVRRERPLMNTEIKI